MNALLKIFLSLLIAFTFSSALSVNANEGEHGEEHAEEKGDHNEEGEEHDEAINLSQKSIALAEIKVEELKEHLVSETLQTSGKIMPDTGRLYHAKASLQGRLVKFEIAPGDTVKRGDALFVVATAQGEKTTRAKRSGTVYSMGARVGDKVDRLSSVVTLADLSELTVSLDLFDVHLKEARRGQRLWLSSPAFPDRKFPGKIEYISLRVDEETRTVKARAKVKNVGMRLKMGMQVFVDIIVRQKKVLSVPLNAVQIVEGKKSVFVAEGNGKFEARPIKIGLEDEHYIQVLGGVRLGEKIVTSGSFLLKSQASKSEMGGHGH